MIPSWKVRLIAAYGVLFGIFAVVFSYMLGGNAEIAKAQDIYDRGVIYGSSLPCPTGER